MSINGRSDAGGQFFVKLWVLRHLNYLFFIILSDIWHSKACNLAVNVAVGLALQSDNSEIALVDSFVTRTTLRTRMDAKDCDYFYTVAWSDFVSQFSVDYENERAGHFTGWN